MIKDNQLKKISIVCGIIFTFWMGLALGQFTAVGQNYYTWFKKPVALIASIPRAILKGTYIRHVKNFVAGVPYDLMIDDFFPYKSGVTMATHNVQPGYLLISRFTPEDNQFVVELMDKVTHQIIHRWIPSYHDLYKAKGIVRRKQDPKSIWNMRVIHPLLLEDGHIIFNTADGRLVRLNKDSEIVWQKIGDFHHSNQLDHNGHLWVPSRIMASEYKMHVRISPLSKAYDERKISLNEESLVKLNVDGEVLQTISVNQILFENGLKALIMTRGVEEKPDDITHLNDIEPVLEDTHFAKQGDLFLSLRSPNMVLQYRPTTQEVVWYQVGPWVAQHDVTIDSQDEISILSNDVPIEPYDEKRLSRVFIYNF